jgi:hypothetical protein
MNLTVNKMWKYFKFTPDDQLKAAISTREYNTIALEAVQQTLNKKEAAAVPARLCVSATGMSVPAIA